MFLLNWPPTTPPPTPQMNTALNHVYYSHKFSCVCVCVSSFITYKCASKQHIALFCLLLSIIKRVHTAWSSGSVSFREDTFLWGFCSSQLKTIQSHSAFSREKKKSPLSANRTQKLDLSLFLVRHLAVEAHWLSTQRVLPETPSFWISV